MIKVNCACDPSNFSDQSELKDPSSLSDQSDLSDPSNLIDQSN